MTDLYVIGAGMGDPRLLTEEAHHMITLCKKLYAFDRIGSSFSELCQQIERVTYTELLTELRTGYTEPVGLLVSGDVGFFSIAATLQKEFSKIYRLHFSCGISSLQYLCAKLGLPTTGVSVVSLHGREAGLLGNISYNRYTFALTGGSHNAGAILTDLTAKGLGYITVTAGEKLSMEEERVHTGTVEALSSLTYDSLTVLLFENPAPANKNAVLFDTQLQRGKAPMTKQEVRWASISYLDIQPGDTVYDIGAGTGSVSLEMGRKAYCGTVYALERNEEAFSLLQTNRKLLGGYNVLPNLGKAIDLLNTLPAPDKVFIGGSGKELPQLIPALLKRSPRVRFVLNAVTLETISEAVQLFKENSLRFEAACINAAHSKALGSYTMMAAQNPVYILYTL